MTPDTTTIHLAPEVWVALITFVAGPLVASVAANLSLRGAVTTLTEKMREFELRIVKLEHRRARARK